MKMTTLTTLLFLSLFLTGGIAHADDSEKSEGKEGMKGMKMHRAGGMDMMKAHQKMTTDTMEMLRETMSILRDLNHTPSAEERERLGEMIAHMDAMMAEREEMQKKMKERMEKHKETKDHDH